MCCNALPALCPLSSSRHLTPYVSWLSQLLAVESMALVHAATLHRLWALSLTCLCLILNVVIPSFAGLYCSSYFNITRTPLVALIRFIFCPY